MKHAICLLAAIAVLTSAHAQEVKRDIPYTKNADKLQTLDVYSPSKAKNLPVVFWIHGGGWQAGDKSQVYMKPHVFNGKRFILVFTTYRLLPNSDMPTYCLCIQYGSHPENHNASSVVPAVARHKAMPAFLILDVANHPDVTAQGLRLGNVLRAADVPVTVFGAKDTPHTKINADLGRP